jgi:cell division transport system permease protein
MPWVVEVVPKLDLTSSPGNRDELAKAIGAIPGVNEVMHPGGEIKRVEALMRLLHGAGLFLGILIGLVVIVVVSNAIKISVFQRKEEIAILKLVGATDAFVRTPFLLSGLAQGTLGSLLGLGALALCEWLLAETVKVALSGALGTFILDPMPAVLWLALLAGGALLGVLGAALSVGRSLRV